MSYMFFHCQNIARINFGNINTEKVENMAYLFDECNLLTSLDLSSFKSSNVLNMQICLKIVVY